jgi:methyl-accepting chemotaxis protein
VVCWRVLRQRCCFAFQTGECALAQRSATAVKEIEKQIEGSTAGIDKGPTLVGEARQIVNEVTSSVQRLIDISRQVGIAGTQMGDVIQQNAALLEQATAVTQSPDAQARMLHAEVNTFRPRG